MRRPLLSDGGVVVDAPLALRTPRTTEKKTQLKQMDSEDGQSSV